MSLSNSAETNLLKLLFQNIDWANVGDAAGLQNSAADGSFYIGLATADPGETGDQTSNEATFTGYARVAVARTTGGWTVSGNNVENAATITFAACTGGSNTITHFVVGRASSGAGEIIVSGTVTPNLAVSNGITPSFAAGALDCTAD